MVACATGVSVAAIQLLVSQSVIGTSSGFMQQNSCATVDQLKQRLQLVIENGDESGAIEVISSLESLTLSKEVLESTRIGLTVNDVRRQTAKTLPIVSARCRALIKTWQKLADFQRPQSSCGDSSNGGTPSLISPASRRGLTPRTPGGGKRVTSTDYKCLPVKNGVSPNGGGSYAPRLDSEKHIVHKSASVGGILCSSSSPSRTAQSATASRGGSQHVSPDMMPAGVDASSFNAKRKAQGSLEDETKAKISKKSTSVVCGVGSAHTGSNGLVAAAIAGGGVSVARKDVQSTAELVAQLTGNLPQNMTISLQNKTDQQSQASQQVPQRLGEKKISSAMVSENGHGIRVVFSTTSQEDVSNSNSDAFTLGKVKRKYTKRAAKFFRNSSADNLESVCEKNYDSLSMSNGDVPKLETIDEKPIDDDNDVMVGNVTDNTDSAQETFWKRRATNHWASLLPSKSELERYKQTQTVRALCSEEYKRTQTLTVCGKKIKALPYCNTGTPGYVRFNYKDKNRFIALDTLAHPLFSLSKRGNNVWAVDRSKFGLL